MKTRPFGDIYRQQKSERESHIRSRFACEGLFPCSGTRDDCPGFWTREIVRAVATHVGRPIKHVESVITNRLCSDHDFDIYYGIWDWKVCRAFMELAREYERQMDWIDASNASRVAKLPASSVQILVEARVVATKTFGPRLHYLRRDLGISQGQFRGSRIPAYALTAAVRRKAVAA
jgi:hypothetical protein